MFSGAQNQIFGTRKTAPDEVSGAARFVVCCLL
jgi:hypothetical protein